MIRRATCAEKSSMADEERAARQIPPRRQPARFAGRCLRGWQQHHQMRVVSCVKPRRSQMIGCVLGSTSVRQLHSLDSVTPSAGKVKKGGSHLYATPATLCKRSGQIFVCSVLCKSSADSLVGTTSPDLRIRNGAISGTTRSGVTWT